MRRDHQKRIDALQKMQVIARVNNILILIAIVEGLLDSQLFVASIISVCYMYLAVVHMLCRVRTSTRHS